MYGLCDCNNFFASCERLFQPSLNGKPVVVLSNNDGCIIARSNEAKEIGIKMGQPLYQARPLIDKYKVAVFSSNYKLYGDMSHRVMQTLKSLVPTVEIYSIDEAFLNFDGVDIDGLQEHGRLIAKTVFRNTGIPVSIGIAPTKTLAKVASKLCKKYPKLKGCCLMYRKEDIEKVLKTFPIEDVWGIGRRYSKMLKSIGIDTAYRFTQCSPDWVKSKMSIVGLRTWKELCGEPMIEFEDVLPDRQSICVSRSFAKELTSFEELNMSLSSFVAIAAAKLRKQRGLASQMQVFIYTNYHNELKPQNHQSRVVKLEVATDSTLELIKYASSVLKTIYSNGYGYKKAGVILSDITSVENTPVALFDTINRPKHTSLMSAIDKINATHGRSMVTIASQGFDKIATNRDYCSPSYTTSWSDIIKVIVV